MLQYSGELYFTWMRFSTVLCTIKDHAHVTVRFLLYILYVYYDLFSLFFFCLLIMATASTLWKPHAVEQDTVVSLWLLFLAGFTQVLSQAKLSGSSHFQKYSLLTLCKSSAVGGARLGAQNAGAILPLDYSTSASVFFSHSFTEQWSTLLKTSQAVNTLEIPKLRFKSSVYLWHYIQFTVALQQEYGH